MSAFGQTQVEHHRQRHAHVQERDADPDEHPLEPADPDRARLNLDDQISIARLEYESHVDPPTGEPEALDQSVVQQRVELITHLLGRGPQIAKDSHLRLITTTDFNSATHSGSLEQCLCAGRRLEDEAHDREQRVGDGVDGAHTT